MTDQRRRPLKVMMAVANNPYPRDSRVRKEAESLTAAGFAVTVVAPNGGDEPTTDVVEGVEVIRYPTPTFGTDTLSYALEFAYVTVATAIAMLRVWMTKGFDVVHLHNPPDTLVFAALLPRLFGKKVVFDHHDLAPELYLAKFDGESEAGANSSVHRALLWFERVSCTLAHRIIVVNESYKAIDIARNRVPIERVVVVRNGPLLANLEAPKPDHELRSRAGTLFGYLGNIAKQDGVDHLILALHELSGTLGYEDWFAVIIGPADDPGPLQALATELGLEDRIWFTGYQPDTAWRRLLGTVDICVVPDPANPLNEKSTMIKFMEYMALAKPVVAYDLTENRASGGDSALYAEPSDPLGLALQFQRLIQNPELSAELGRRGKNRVRQKLAWEYSAENLLDLYRALEMESPHARSN